MGGESVVRGTIADLPFHFSDTGQAFLLGLVQGPTELMPVSSSAHLEMVPRLAGWDWEALDPELRKAFEVALHAGTALAMVALRRRELVGELARLDARRASVLVLSFLPAALAGYGLERQIERRLGGPSVTAVGLAVGAVAMALTDRMPQERQSGHPGALDGLALGVGQAAALVPGVSRNGATLTAARLRGFTREQSNALSRTVALPVIAAQGGPARPPGGESRPGPVDRDRDRSLLPLDRRLGPAGRPGRAGPVARPVCGLPSSVRPVDRRPTRRRPAGPPPDPCC